MIDVCGGGVHRHLVAASKAARLQLAAPEPDAVPMEEGEDDGSAKRARLMPSPPEAPGDGIGLVRAGPILTVGSSNGGAR